MRQKASKCGILAVGLLWGACGFQAMAWDVEITVGTTSGTLNTSEPVGTASNPIVICAGGTANVTFSAAAVNRPPTSIPNECLVSGPTWNWTGDVNNGSQTVANPYTTEGEKLISATATASYSLTALQPGGCGSDPASKTTTRNVIVKVLRSGAGWTVVFIPQHVWPSTPSQSYLDLKPA